MKILNETMKSTTFVVCDNENTYKLIADTIGIPMIGCNPHRLNLTFKKYLPESESSILCEHVNTLVQKLSSHKKAARQRSKTELRPIQMNNTRWDFTHAMLKRYIELRDHIDESDPVMACFYPHLPTL